MQLRLLRLSFGHTNRRKRAVEMHCRPGLCSAVVYFPCQKIQVRLLSKPNRRILCQSKARAFSSFPSRKATGWASSVNSFPLFYNGPAFCISTSLSHIFLKIVLFKFELYKILFFEKTYTYIYNTKKF